MTTVRKRKPVVTSESNPILLTFNKNHWSSGSRRAHSHKLFDRDGLTITLHARLDSGEQQQITVNFSMGSFWDEKTKKEYWAPYIHITSAAKGNTREIFGGELSKIPLSIENLLEHKQPGETKNTRTDYDFVLEENYDND